MIQWETPAHEDIYACVLELDAAGCIHTYCLVCLVPRFRKLALDVCAATGQQRSGGRVCRLAVPISCKARSPAAELLVSMK